MLNVEPDGEHLTGFCDCCGKASRRVWGYVTRSEAAEAAYFVRWTQGHPERGADWDIIVGEWDGAPVSERVGVSLALRLTEDGPQFMFVDAEDRDFGKGRLFGCALARSEVTASPLAARVFEIVDAIWLGDPRLSDFRSEGGGSA